MHRGRIFTLIRVILGIHNYSVYCNDTAGNWNNTEIRSIAFDIIPPIINLEFPANNALEERNKTITFKYNATDTLSDITNCSLYINALLNETDTNITEGVTQNFTKTLANDNYNWSVKCYDTLDNFGSSPIWYLNVSVGHWTGTEQLNTNSTTGVWNVTLNATAEWFFSASVDDRNFTVVT